MNLYYNNYYKTLALLSLLIFYFYIVTCTLKTSLYQNIFCYSYYLKISLHAFKLQSVIILRIFNIILANLIFKFKLFKYNYLSNKIVLYITNFLPSSGIFNADFTDDGSLVMNVVNSGDYSIYNLDPSTITIPAANDLAIQAQIYNNQSCTYKKYSIDFCTYFTLLVNS